MLARYPARTRDSKTASAKRLFDSTVCVTRAILYKFVAPYGIMAKRRVRALLGALHDGHVHRTRLANLLFQRAAYKPIEHEFPTRTRLVDCFSTCWQFLYATTKRIFYLACKHLTVALAAGDLRRASFVGRLDHTCQVVIEKAMFINLPFLRSLTVGFSGVCRKQNN